MSTPSNPLPNSAWSNPIAIQDPDRDGAAFPDPQQSANADGQDAIREGKQRAKEAMQAQSIPSHESPRQPNMSNGTPYPNGTPQLSRKRSRDGTQLPMTHAGAGHGVADTSQPSHHDILLDRYIQRDLLHGVAMNDQADRSRQLILYKAQERDWYERDVTLRRKADPGAIFGYGYAGYGNGTTQGSPNIIWPATRGAPKGRRNKQLHINRKDNQTQAEQHEELVPIRLDIELEKMRLRDTFTWNLHEKCVPPDLFADYLLEDLRIPPEHIPEVSRLVKAEMQEQLQNYYPHIIVEDGPLEPGRPYFEHKDDEMRIQIKLNITIGRITLVDQFEWDINNPLNCPEEFARHMAWENALSGEFTTAIAHSIREQSQQYTKALFLTNHAFDGRPIEDPELRDGFLPAPINSAFRTPQAQKDFTPYMYEMSEAELERTETSMMREHRAQKRQLNRRGGPALPDLREKPRTVRSLLVHSVIPGAVESFETTGILKTRRAGRGQRRAGRTTDGDVDSEELDSEESGADSPAPSALATGGTARTRGMRGAAAAAQVNMRAGYGRSATPDAQVTSVPPTEVKASARPSKLREESIALEEDEKLIVKLKINKTRLKTLLDELLAKKRAKEFPLSGYASGPPTMSLQPGTPGRGATSTPSMTPKTLPARSTPQPNGSHSRATSTARQAQQPAVIYDARGAVDTDRWPAPEDSPPAPPPWLQEAIQALRTQHPDDNFMPLMRPYCIDNETGQPQKAGVQQGDVAPPGTKFQFLPRIRCNDCPGKLYTAVPGKVVQDFEVHLRNRGHRETVMKRKEKA